MSGLFFDKAVIQAKLRALSDGTMPLQTIFWSYFFLPSAGLWILSGIGGFPGLLLSLANFGWCAYMAKPVIVAANQYTGEKHLALLAKGAVIVILLSALFRLFAF